MPQTGPHVVGDHAASLAQYRRFLLRRECEANAGHLHHYDHLTLFHGPARLSVAGEPDREFAPAAAPGDFRCGEFHIFRPKMRDRRTAAAQTGLFAGVRGCRIEFVTADGPGRRDIEPFETVLIRPGVTWSVDAGEPLLALDTDPNTGGSPVGFGADFALVPKDAYHTIKAREDNVVYDCVFAHRTLDGSGFVSQRYVGNPDESEPREPAPGAETFEYVVPPFRHPEPVGV